MGKFTINWSKQARESLKEIYDFYKERSIEAARHMKADLLNSPKTIYFSKQYQIDDINPKYRRIVVRHYKVLYKEVNGTIQVIDIISTLQSPEILESK